MLRQKAIDQQSRPSYCDILEMIWHNDLRDVLKYAWIVGWNQQADHNNRQYLEVNSVWVSLSLA